MKSDDQSQRHDQLTALIQVIAVAAHESEDQRAQLMAAVGRVAEALAAEQRAEAEARRRRSRFRVIEGGMAAAALAGAWAMAWWRNKTAVTLVATSAVGVAAWTAPAVISPPAQHHAPSVSEPATDGQGRPPDDELPMPWSPRPAESTPTWSPQQEPDDDQDEATPRPTDEASTSSPAPTPSPSESPAPDPTPDVSPTPSPTVQDENDDQDEDVTDQPGDLIDDEEPLPSSTPGPPDHAQRPAGDAVS